MRASSLPYTTIAINREIDSRYDIIKEVSEHLDEIAEALSSASTASTAASSATVSAATASTKASEASASVTESAANASAALTSKNAAAASEASALTYKNSAGTSATTATTKASAASASAAAALVSETNANTSKNTAATSATTATTKASEASTSATNASTSATNASTSASAASVSASTSATKATEAATSASTTLGYKNDVSTMKLAIETIYDTFDDRFLGTKTANPAVDNDGNALLDGALFFDTTTNAMKVYDVGTTTWYAMPQIYLNSLLDVQLTSLTTGHILVWNGTKWVNVLLTKASIGLANVDNTSDTSKPVSTAQQTALNLKANLASPTFTGTVSGVTKAMVGLGSVDNTSDATKNVLSATKWTTARTINGVAFDGSANITIYDSTKVAKVASTDNAIVRFNGTNGEVQDSLITIDAGGNLIGARLIGSGYGNDYYSGAVQLNGNGSTVVPSIGFHQPGAYGGSLQQVSASEFSFFNQYGAYASLKNNINMQNAINVNGTVGASVLTSNVIVESGSNANGYYTKFANGSMMEYKTIECLATANARYTEYITWPVTGPSSGTGCCLVGVTNTYSYTVSQPPAFNSASFYFVTDTTQTYTFVLTKYTP